MFRKAVALDERIHCATLFVRIVGILCAASALNYFLCSLLIRCGLSYAVSARFFTLVRLLLMFLGGWFIFAKAATRLWVSAVMGPVVLVVDHIALKGGDFLYEWIFKADRMYLTAFFGVMVSFVMFMPFAMIISLVGGFFASRRNARQSHPAGD